MSLIASPVIEPLVCVCVCGFSMWDEKEGVPGQGVQWA